MVFSFLAPSILCWKGVRITYLGLKLCTVFFKSRMLWYYCTSAITIPVKGTDEEDAVFLGRMIE